MYILQPTCPMWWVVPESIVGSFNSYNTLRPLCCLPSLTGTHAMVYRIVRSRVRRYPKQGFDAREPVNEEGRRYCMVAICGICTLSEVKKYCCSITIYYIYKLNTMKTIIFGRKSRFMTCFAFKDQKSKCH